MIILFFRGRGCYKRTKRQKKDVFLFTSCSQWECTVFREWTRLIGYGVGQKAIQVYNDASSEELIETLYRYDHLYSSGLSVLFLTFFRFVKGIPGPQWRSILIRQGEKWSLFGRLHNRQFSEYGYLKGNFFLSLLSLIGKKCKKCYFYLISCATFNN